MHDLIINLLIYCVCVCRVAIRTRTQLWPPLCGSESFGQWNGAQHFWGDEELVDELVFYFKRASDFVMWATELVNEMKATGPHWVYLAITFAPFIAPFSVFPFSSRMILGIVFNCLIVAQLEWIVTTIFVYLSHGSF